MYHFILPVTWITLAGCWPMSEAEYKLDSITAQDSQDVGSSATNSSTITAQTLTLAKEINTTLAGLIVLLTIGTYWYLMRYTPTLSNEVILPSKFLGDNIAAVLSLTWPKNAVSPANETVNQYPYKWVLFYKKTAYDPERRLLFEQILGFDDFNEEPRTLDMGKMSMVTVKAFSPIMKSLVQIAIWNYLSLWLVLNMIVNTLVYNGFLSHGITNDSVIRLVLVGVYAVASVGQRYRTTTLLYRNFTSVLFQTCWTIICKEFVFGTYSHYRIFSVDQHTNVPLLCRDDPVPESFEMVWTSFDFELFGTMEQLRAYSYLIEANNPIGSHLRVRGKVESKYDKFVKPIREAELKAYEKVTDSALEKVLANVAVLLGICLATALAPWNSTQTISATSAQLGSYALLLSVSAGFLALISSMTQLTNATGSARILLLLQEKTIAARELNPGDGDVSKMFSLRDEPDFSLSKDIKGKSQLTSWSLWRSMSLFDKLRCLLLGPALMFIPRMHGDRLSHPDHGSDYLSITVQGVQFACWTIGSILGVRSGMSRLDSSSDKEIRQQRDAETRQKRENVDAERQSSEDMYAGRTDENDNIVKHRQEDPGIGGKLDASDAHE